MAVYVDDMRAPFRRMIMCHMIADTDEELHEMAARVGVARKWHQAPPQHQSHYDISLTMREAAVRAGAIEITWKQCGCMPKRYSIEGRFGPPDEAVEWLKRRIQLLNSDCLDLFE